MLRCLRVTVVAVVLAAAAALAAAPAVANHPPVITGFHGRVVQRFPATGPAYVEVAIDTQFGYSSMDDPFVDAVRASARITKVVGIRRSQINQLRVGTDRYGVALDDVNIPDQHASSPSVPFNSGTLRTIRAQSDFVFDLSPGTPGAQLCDPAGDNINVASRVFFTLRRASDNRLLSGSVRSNFTDADLAPCPPPPPPPPSADLEVNLTDSPDPVLHNQLVTYTVVAVNNGPNTANDALVVVDLADSLTGPAVTPPPGVICTIGVGNVVRCPVGALADDEIVTFTVSATAAVVGTLTNTATLTSSSSYADSDTEGETTTVIASADVSLDKALVSADPTPPTGSTVVYEFRVTNSGPDTAVGAFVVDDWPGPLGTPTESTTDDATCVFDATADTLRCDYGTIAAGATEIAQVSATITAPPDTVVTNTATADHATSGDPDSGDRTDSVTVIVTAA
jgi:uncharacterized repeat protein (TIGR01451 family)